jgi:release factor glutamine methyltransferase
MKNSKILFNDFIQKITIREDRDEIAAIGYLVFEHLFNLSRTDILMDKPVLLDENEASRLREIAKRISDHEPVQYILGTALFFGRHFSVNPSVLIPRPETEELVHEILRRNEGQSNSLRVLDIGTGSGCIPITIQLEIPQSTVFAVDISEEALVTARSNAIVLHADVGFFKCDILNELTNLTQLDIVISNPPYIAEEEKLYMQPNVIAHEPHLALFVNNDDPLIFYRAIAKQSSAMLQPGGQLWFEINERFGSTVKGLMEKNGFHSVEILRDTAGKERFVSGKLR